MFCKGKKGFTLIELVVSLAVSSLLLLVLFSFSTIAFRMNKGINHYSQAQNVAQGYLQTIESQLRYANNLNIEHSAPDEFNESMRYIYSIDGEVFKKNAGGNADSLLPNLYNGEYNIDLNFKAVNSKVVEISLAVFNNTTKLYSITSKLHINNIISGSITGESQGSCVSYELKGISVSSILISSPRAMIDKPGEPMQLSAEIYPVNAENKGIAWSVDNPEIATITQTGLLQPLKNGVVAVTATALDGSGVQASKEIIITNQDIVVTSVELYTNVNKNRVKTGEKITILAKITPDDATNKKLVWNVDNPQLATIDQNGILTAGYTKNKSVIVTASTTDGSQIVRTIEILIN
jgi:prepilin-type N-terminal cleavage/methylation domain-containing protein